MKILKVAFVAMLTILFINPAEAQLLNKLKKKAEQSFERTVERKVGEKTEQETEKLFDRTVGSVGVKGALGGNAAAPESVYSFEYEYVVHSTYETSNKVDELEQTYYLKSNASSFAVVPKTEGREQMTMVFDEKNNTIHSFVENEGQKFRFSNGFNLSKATDEVVSESGVQITELSDIKVINGFSCKGYQVKGVSEEGLHVDAKVWVYKHPTVSFAQSTGVNGKKASASNQQYFKKMDGLVMEMDSYTYELKRNGHKKNEIKSKMLCTSFQPKAFSIHSADYPSMME